MILKNLLRGLLAVVLVGATAQLAQAQDDPEEGGPIFGAPTAVPLDGGASLLLAGGVAYGLRQLRARKAR